MNINRNISITQIIWIIGLLLGLGLAFMMGVAVGHQNLSRITLVIGGGIGISIFLILGKNYWMLIPFSLAANFPAVPLGGRALEFPELAIAGCALFFISRVATRKERLRLFSEINAPFLVFIAWVGMVFLLNPVGFAMIGSDVGGARFYFKLGLAFASFVILSNRTYTEKDIKWVLGFLVFGAFFSMVYGMAKSFLVGPEVDPTTGMVVESFYTWHQVLSIPAITLSMLIFSRWKPKEIFGFQHPAILLIYLLCIGFVLLSGKRMGLIAVLLSPFIGSIVFRQPRYIFIASILIGGALLALVVGQGQWIQLPLVAQRTLSWLPGDWDPELEAMRGGSDEWRAELRHIALKNIQRHPWIGRGFFVDIQDVVTAIGMQERGGGMDIQVASYALGHSWHNTWLGYAADFGIPFSIIQAAIWAVILALSYRTFRIYGNKSFLGIFSLYVFIYTCRDLIASWTSGHSSTDAYSRWWMYGIIVTIYLQNKVKEEKGKMRMRHLAGERGAIIPQSTVNIS